MGGRQEVRKKQLQYVSLKASIMCFAKECSHDVFCILSFNIKIFNETNKKIHLSVLIVQHIHMDACFLQVKLYFRGGQAEKLSFRELLKLLKWSLRMIKKY